MTGFEQHGKHDAEMVLKGPSAYDARRSTERGHRLTQERGGPAGRAARRLSAAQRVERKPYYVLDVPWSSAEQREAAGKFLDFLQTEPVQKQSLVHGFRPGNPAVPVRFAGSPFVSYQRFGLSVELGEASETPRAEVINNLLAGWERAHGSP